MRTSKRTCRHNLNEIEMDILVTWAKHSVTWKDDKPKCMHHIDFRKKNVFLKFVYLYYKLPDTELIILTTIIIVIISH